MENYVGPHLCKWKCSCSQPKLAPRATSPALLKLWAQTMELRSKSPPQSAASPFCRQLTLPKIGPRIGLAYPVIWTKSCWRGTARSRHEVHPILPSDYFVRSGRTARAACPTPEPECLCGALGQVGEGGVPVQGGSLRRALATAGPERIRRIKARAISCCSLGIRRSVVTSPCNAVSASVGSCVITSRGDVNGGGA